MLKTSLSIHPGDARVSGSDLQQILGVGITAALSNLMQSLCVLIANQFLLPYGNDRIAAMGIVLKVNMIAQLMLVGFAFGGVPLFGYLFGANHAAQLKKLIRFCLVFLTVLSLGLTALILLNAPGLMRVFVKDPDMIINGATMLRWQAVSTVFAAIVILMTVLFQAAGNVIPAFILSISRQGVVYVAAMVICAKLFGYQGILMSQAAADIVSALIAILLIVLFHPFSMQKENELRSQDA